MLQHLPARLWAWLLAAACLVGAGTSSASPPASGFDALGQASNLALDDPRAAESHTRRRLAASRAAGDADTAFWLQLALVDLMILTDREADSRRELVAARALMSSAPSAQRQRLWLEFYERFARTGPVALPEFRREQAAAREAARMAGDEALLCALDVHDAVLQIELDAVDEAWVALESVDRCAVKLGEPALRAYALGAMGPLAGRVGAKDQPQAFFQRALAALGDLPTRFKRAWLLEDLGWAQLKAGDTAAAKQSFKQALALSTEIADVSGVMRGNEGLAEVMLRRREAAAALSHARAALAQAAAHEGLRFRKVTAQTQVVEALALQGGPELAAEIDRLRAMEALDPTARTGALIARAAATGLRALGRHEPAYAELERYIELTAADERSQREHDAQRLQARYDAVRREAENEALRHSAEVARLELQARSERQRGLWALVGALGLALVGGGAYFARALHHRRQLAELALRDELTGAPNRRAVLAFAREEFAVTRRLNQPLTIALLDLDHFKHFNDTHGHATGDRVLEAFARAAACVVRGQDRVGRWGGEEWLLVMPGTRAVEMPAVFDRLRQALAAQAVPGLPAPHGVTFSMGVAERHAAHDSVEALIAEADHHVYRAKAQGRDLLCAAPLPGMREAGPQAAG
ncbi:MAG: diguanylate cyclase [Rubrivivax sp.]|nr:diguanylate cyclase [Rubrivivax sp.]